MPDVETEQNKLRWIREELDNLKCIRRFILNADRMIDKAYHPESHPDVVEYYKTRQDLIPVPYNKIPVDACKELKMIIDESISDLQNTATGLFAVVDDLDSNAFLSPQIDTMSSHG